MTQTVDALHPEAVEFFEVDFEAWAEGEVLIDEDVAHEGDAHAVISGVSRTNYVVKFWISGGVAGRTARIRVRADANDGRRAVQIVKIPIMNGA